MCKTAIFGSRRIILIGMAAALSLSGAGKQNPTPVGSAEVAISSAVVPPGATTQLAFRLTQPSPIMSTGSGFALGGFSVNGIGLWSSTGTACGVGLVRNGVLDFALSDPTGALGTATDYPFLTLTMTAPAGVKTGTVFPFGWSPDAWMSNAAGPVPFITKPGKVIIGGSISISGIFPGGGTYPAGTKIRVLGAGFQNTTRLQTTFHYFSSTITANEIDLYLREQTTMDAQQVSVANADGSAATYFAYLRGALVRPPSNALLQSGEFAFPVQTHALAFVPASVALPDSQWIALALQNPNPGPAAVTIEVGPRGQGREVLIVLPPGGRMVDTISGMLNTTPAQAAQPVSITSTAPIQMFGIHGDDAAQTLKPFVLTF